MPGPPTSTVQVCLMQDVQQAQVEAVLADLLELLICHPHADDDLADAGLTLNWLMQAEVAVRRLRRLR